jgi:hypothetical protein
VLPDVPPFPVHTSPIGQQPPRPLLPIMQYFAAVQKLPSLQQVSPTGMQLLTPQVTQPVGQESL